MKHWVQKLRFGARKLHKRGKMTLATNVLSKRKAPPKRQGIYKEENIGWSEDELGDIVVEPLPADRIVRCGGEPFRTEDGPDDRRGG